jgi:hypothetical protein
VTKETDTPATIPPAQDSTNYKERSVLLPLLAADIWPHFTRPCPVGTQKKKKKKRVLTDEVCLWVLALGLETRQMLFRRAMDGDMLVTLDGEDFKELGLPL